MRVDVSPALETDYYVIEERESPDRVRAFCEKEIIPVIGEY